MAKHIHTGKIGEAISISFFKERGYVILETNWRHSRWEVDIIAAHNGILHFVEVKTRRSKNFGMPEDKVNNQKVNYLINAAEEYLHRHPQWKRIQFDILSVSIAANNTATCYLIEDIFL